MNQDEIKKIVENSLLRADHKFEFPPVCLEISGQYGNQIFATLGNFSTILAAPKVGKTTATGIIVSALISNRRQSNFIPLLPDNKKVIVWIDTEQGTPECLKIIQSICSQATGNKTEMPENFIFSSLRKHSKSIRLEAIEYLINNTPNIGFVVIDGVRDLVSSINDEREATLIADNLLRWTQQLNIHILTILHQNKGDFNARGHLGTELMNKAETVATLNRGENNGNRITSFEPKLTRHKEFESFAFTIDETGMIIGSEIKSNYQPLNPKVDQLTLPQIEAIFKHIFHEHIYMTYRPLYESLQKSLKTKFNIEFGIEKAKKLVVWLKNNNYINYNEDSKIYSSNISL